MDDEIGANQRRRSSKNNNNNEDDHEVVIESHNNNEGDDAQLGLALSLGPASYSTQISQPMTETSLRLAPPSPITALPPPDLFAHMTSSSCVTSQPYFTASSSLNNPLFQLPTFNPSVSFLPSPVYSVPPPSNQTQARPMRPADDQSRRAPRSQLGNRDNNEIIPAPFPWATNIRGKIQSLEDLESKQITVITGDVQCKHCENKYQVSYNLREKFDELKKILMRKMLMRERAPSNWTHPEPARCDLCGREKAVKPVIADRKSKINWLFLLLGQTLGFCSLEQLKNFCKHSKSHRTGAKDRVLYLTYLGLCKMLQPKCDLFNRESCRR